MLLSNREKKETITLGLVISLWIIILLRLGFIVIYTLSTVTEPSIIIFGVQIHNWLTTLIAMLILFIFLFITYHKKHKKLFKMFSVLIIITFTLFIDGIIGYNFMVITIT